MNKISIFESPELFKFNVGDVAYFEDYTSGKILLCAGIINDGYKNSEGCIWYKLNGMWEHPEESLFSSVDEHKMKTLVKERENYYDRLARFYNEVQDRNQILADFIMKSRMVNGSMPEKFTIKLTNEASVIKSYMISENEYTTREFVDKITISQNDEGEYVFSFVDVRYGLETNSAEVISDVALIINTALEDYVVRLNETM
jgi:hypothetical protein